MTAYRDYAMYCYDHRYGIAGPIVAAAVCCAIVVFFLGFFVGWWLGRTRWQDVIGAENCYDELEITYELSNFVRRNPGSAERPVVSSLPEHASDHVGNINISVNLKDSRDNDTGKYPDFRSSVPNTASSSSYASKSDKSTNTKTTKRIHV